MSTNTSGSTTRHHCYLLQSLSSPKKSYIGYTVNPSRRLKQHNGLIKGGANYTSKFRPWKFIAITEGFATEQKGLQFEWAWQHPKRSKIFRHGLGGGGLVAGMLEKQSDYMGKLRLLMILLCESKGFKDDSLNVYFFERDIHKQFHTLFNDLDYSSDEEDGIGQGWCKALPDQMETLLLDNVENMPFHKDIVRKSKRNRRSGNNQVTTDSDVDGTNSLLETERHKSFDDGSQDMNAQNKRGNALRYQEQVNSLLSNSDSESDYEIGQENFEVVQQIQHLSIDGSKGRNVALLTNTVDNCSDSESLGVIDLLDSSEDEICNKISSTISSARIGWNKEHDFDMELSSPPRHNSIDIDWTEFSPMSVSTAKKIQTTSKNVGYDTCFEDLDSINSNETIDLCSPDKSIFSDVKL